MVCQEVFVKIRKNLGSKAEETVGLGVRTHGRTGLIARSVTKYKKLLLQTEGLHQEQWIRSGRSHRMGLSFRDT